MATILESNGCSVETIYEPPQPCFSAIIGEGDLKIEMALS